MKDLVVNEFQKRVFMESYERIYKCLTMIDEKSLWDSPNETIPSIGNMILHICGNARQWILSGIGGKEDNRDRDQEFVKQEKIKKSELVFLLENIKVNLRQTLHDMEPSVLEKEMVLQGFNVTGFSAIVHVIEHFSYHTGQITTLTKYYTNRPTAYYGDVDLNVQNRLN